MRFLLSKKHKEDGLEWFFVQVSDSGNLVWAADRDRAMKLTEEDLKLLIWELSHRGETDILTTYTVDEDDYNKAWDRAMRGV